MIDETRFCCDSRTSPTGTGMLVTFTLPVGVSEGSKNRFMLSSSAVNWTTRDEMSVPNPTISTL